MRLPLGVTLPVLFTPERRLDRRKPVVSGRLLCLDRIKPLLGILGRSTVFSMDDNERQSVKELLLLARLAILAMLVAGGYMQRDILIGLI